MRPIASLTPIVPVRAPLDAAARAAGLRARRAYLGSQSVPGAPAPADRVAPVRLLPDRYEPGARRAAHGDVEVAVRVYADGRQVSVARRLVDGRTVGIDAVVR